MNLQEAKALVDGTCPNKHEINHKVLPIPERDDICFVYCTGYNNRLFLVWEENKKLFIDEIGGENGLQVIVDEASIKIKNSILEIYCSVENFVGCSGGVLVRRKIGGYGVANPAPIKTISL